MFLKRNVPLPSVAPATKRTGLSDALASLAAGENIVVPYNAPATKQACKRIVLAFAEAGDVTRAFAVWPSQSDGSAAETGTKFALVARLTEAQVEEFEAQRPGCVIRARDAA